MHTRAYIMTFTWLGALRLQSGPRSWVLGRSHNVAPGGGSARSRRVAQQAKTLIVFTLTWQAKVNGTRVPSVRSPRQRPHPSRRHLSFPTSGTPVATRCPRPRRTFRIDREDRRGESRTQLAWASSWLSFAWSGKKVMGRAWHGFGSVRALEWRDREF